MNALRYAPPYENTNRMVAGISSISEKLGRISSYRALEARPQLRRNNRIRSIHSSLAIEANSLSLDEVKGVIEGKSVLGPPREIQEVLNAYAAYEQIGTFDPYDMAQMKRLHGIMTHLTVEESGSFRRGEEGVFDGDRCIFMAPPAKHVTQLMEQLFGWMWDAAEEVHPLILSSVFHYEFVFIHPFADGNGRMARLWQTALLTQWSPMLQYLPIESQIHAFQQEYYQAIAACHTAGSATGFVEFMLRMIEESLELVLSQAQRIAAHDSVYVQRLLAAMEYGIPYTANQIMEALGLKSKETLRKHYLDPALQQGLVQMAYPDKPTSRNQTYTKQ